MTEKLYKRQKKQDKTNELTYENFERSDGKSPLRERRFRGEVTLTYFHISAQPPLKGKER